MEDKIWIRVPLPKDFSLKLDQHILDLKKMNAKKSKSDLIIKFAQIGFNQEVKKWQFITFTPNHTTPS